MSELNYSTRKGKQKLKVETVTMAVAMNIAGQCFCEVMMHQHTYFHKESRH